MTAVGLGKIDTVVAELVAEQPLLDTLTLYEPATETVILCVLAPFDHK